MKATTLIEQITLKNYLLITADTFAVDKLLKSAYEKPKTPEQAK